MSLSLISQFSMVFAVGLILLMESFNFAVWLVIMLVLTSSVSNRSWVTLRWVTSSGFSRKMGSKSTRFKPVHTTNCTYSSRNTTHISIYISALYNQMNSILLSNTTYSLTLLTLLTRCSRVCTPLFLE